MEQVDQIIIVTLRDIGIDIDSEIGTLNQFSTNLIVQSAAKCLNIINGETKLSEKLPENMAGRYRVGIELANACKNLGYKADLGYETFLYSNDVEIRRLLMFLVEKLPRTRQDSDDNDINQKSSLQSSIASEIRRQLQLPWLPPQCHSNHLVWDGNRKNGQFHFVGGFQQFKTNNLKISDTAPCLGLQCQPKELLASLLELSTKLNQEMDISNITFTNAASTTLSKKNNFEELLKKANEERKGGNASESLLSKISSLNLCSNNAEKVEHNIFKITENILHGSKVAEEVDGKREDREDTPSKVEDEEELIKQHEIEKEELLNTYNLLNEKLDNSKGKIDNATRRLSDLEQSRKIKEEEVEKLKDEYMLKKKTLQLVPDDKNAVDVMKEKLTIAHSESKNVKEMWSKKESDLQNELEKNETELKTKELQTSEYIEDVKLMREEITELMSSIENKEETYRELEVQVESLPNSINRNTHTKKILDIVDKIKRQKEHITTILNETKTVQKEINSLNGKIERSFIETDEMIFRDAKNNDQCRKAYKLLANLQSEFNALVRGLDDIGTINREVRDIEDLLQREKQKNTTAQTMKMSKDLEAVVSENDKMIVAIKKAKAQKR